MGTDIHLYIETKDASGDWSIYGERSLNRWYDAAEKAAAEAEGDTYWEPEFSYPTAYDWRNYSVFAMLADVHNSGFNPRRSSFSGEAFADDDKLVPIAMPRGLPSDVSAPVSAMSDGWGGHSHSWLTADELLEVPWAERLQTQRGWVTPREFDRFNRFGVPPQSYSGGVGGFNVKHVSNEQMATLIETKAVDTPWNGDKVKDDGGWDIGAGAGYYTMVEWTSTWEELLDDEFKGLLQKVAQIAVNECEGDLARVRCVFWFDN